MAREVVDLSKMGWDEVVNLIAEGWVSERRFGCSALNVSNRLAQLFVEAEQTPYPQTYDRNRFERLNENGAKAFGIRWVACCQVAANALLSVGMNPAKHKTLGVEIAWRMALLIRQTIKVNSEPAAQTP